nr:MAG TPA: hypothetical protein [Caudoviricetes sp.]
MLRAPRPAPIPQMMPASPAKARHLCTGGAEFKDL